MNELQSKLLDRFKNIFSLDTLLSFANFNFFLTIIFYVIVLMTIGMFYLVITGYISDRKEFEEYNKKQEEIAQIAFGGHIIKLREIVHKSRSDIPLSAILDPQPRRSGVFSSFGSPMSRKSAVGVDEIEIDKIIEEDENEQK